MKQRTYSIGELKRIIKESTDDLKKDYKLVKFNDDNSKINREGYKEMAKATTESLSNGKTKTTNYPQNTRGMESLRPQNATKEMRDNWAAQAEGYVNAADKKAHSKEPLGNAERNDGSITKALTQRAKEEASGHTKASQIGLTGKESNIKQNDDTMFESNKLTKLTFKRTSFLTENHMLSRVPDSMKVENKRFIMKDKDNHEYLVEWHDEPKVINRSHINEEQNRIKELFNYKSNVVTSSNTSRIAESKNFEDVLGKVRKLMY